MKMYGGVAVLLHAFLTSALYGGVWSTSHHGRLETFCYHLKPDTSCIILKQILKKYDVCGLDSSGSV